MAAPEKDKYNVELSLEVEPALGLDKDELERFLSTLALFLPKSFKIRDVRIRWYVDDSE